MVKIAFTTLGCKTNQYDGEELMERCRLAGFEVVPLSARADVYIVNTCTVTATADGQSRRFLRRLRRQSPRALIVAMGCSVVADARAYHAMPEVDACFGVRSADEIVAFLRSVIPAKLVLERLNRGAGIHETRNPDPGSLAGMTGVPVNQSRARALLKIQDGCDRRCTYCAVWRVRGPARSMPMDDLVENYRALAAYSEIMLTGIHIGQYGLDLKPASSLGMLLDRMGRESGPRLRLGSLDPDEVGDPLVDLMRAGRLCRHVHLSIQSGCDRVLAAMGRGYAADDVRACVSGLVRAVPGVAIGADIIVGFPGETEEDFAATRDLLEELPFAYLHVFPYSARRNTPAASMPGQVPAAVRKARARMLIELGRIKRRRYIDERHASEVEAVVISRACERGMTMRAVSDNYLTLRGPAIAGSYGSIITARIGRPSGGEVCASWG